MRSGCARMRADARMRDPPRMRRSMRAHPAWRLIKAIVCIAAGNQLFARAAAISSAKHLGAAGLPRDFGALGRL